jgi:hypothetical protein
LQRRGAQVWPALASEVVAHRWCGLSRGGFLATRNSS